VAKLAAMRTQNTAVKAFANMLVTDHEGHLEASSIVRRRFAVSRAVAV
jgi:predicted outer membrane protein